VTVAQPEVLELIASRIVDNIRALEGALIRIVAHHSLTGHAIDLQLATDVLDEIHPAPTPTETSIERVQATVATYFGLSVPELLSPSRKERISWPRQLAIHLARELTDSSLNQLGQAFGGRNHATVLHSCKRVAERIIANREAAHDLDNIRQQLISSRVDHRS
jgi:chromosomal replication initiator protein